MRVKMPAGGAQLEPDTELGCRDGWEEAAGAARPWCQPGWVTTGRGLARQVVSTHKPSNPGPKPRQSHQ